MSKYRMPTGLDAAFCHRVTQERTKGWVLHGHHFEMTANKPKHALRSASNNLNIRSLLAANAASALARLVQPA